MIKQQDKRNPHFYIVGTKGIPANYGGYETFAEKVSAGLVREGIDVTVFCEGHEKGIAPDQYNGINRVFIPVSKIPYASSIINDAAALKYVVQNGHSGDICYLTGYGIGIFGKKSIKALKKRGIKFMVNPDGIEWKRAKWPWFGRVYLKMSEKSICCCADKVVCDSATIQGHIWGRCKNPDTTVIEYGAEVYSQPLSEEAQKYLTDLGLAPNEYYLAVGRYVPENNLKIMASEYRKQKRRCKMLCITDKKPSEEPVFDHPDIVCPGSLYDQKLLLEIRSHAFAYLHGHEVGGTNPSLLESMGCSSVVMALDVPFNREVLQEGGLFFSKKEGSLDSLFAQAESMSNSDLTMYREYNLNRIQTHYNWQRICDLYKELVMKSDH